MDVSKFDGYMNDNMEITHFGFFFLPGLLGAADSE
jgi:hypothetical protein